MGLKGCKWSSLNAPGTETPQSHPYCWKKLEKFQNKMGLKGCKWSSLEAPGTETPQSHPYLKLQEFPFPNKDKTEGFQCLGHSNWTTCSPLSHFCSGKFSTFSISYWGSNSYYPRGLIMRKGNSPNSRNGWDWGVSVPGAFKLLITCIVSIFRLWIKIKILSVLSSVSPFRAVLLSIKYFSQGEVLIRKYCEQTSEFGARDAIFDRSGCQFASKTLERQGKADWYEIELRSKAPQSRADGREI